MYLTLLPAIVSPGPTVPCATSPWGLPHAERYSPTKRSGPEFLVYETLTVAFALRLPVTEIQSGDPEMSLQRLQLAAWAASANDVAFAGAPDAAAIPAAAASAPAIRTRCLRDKR